MTEALNAPPTLLPQIATAEAPAMLIEQLDNIGTLSMRELPHLTIPRGGGTTWEINHVTGKKALMHLDVILLTTYAKQRAWWSADAEDDTTTPPDCSSIDGLVGVGNNLRTLAPDGAGQHECLACPWGAWGSDRKGGKGKDCGEFATMLLLHPLNFLPSWMKAPPTSLGALKQYQIDLVNAQMQVNKVLTRIVAKPEKQGSRQWASLQFSVVRELTPEECERTEYLMRALRPRFAPKLSDMRALGAAETGRAKPGEPAASTARPKSMDDVPDAS